MILLALALLASATALQAQVTVSTEVTGNAVPNGTVNVAATVEVTDGSSIQSFAWTQTFGASAIITGGNTATATVMLGDMADYKEHLFHVLTEPPVSGAQLPPNVPKPVGEFVGGLQNRFQVVGLNPFNLEEGALVTLEVEVVTTSGTYFGEAEIHTALPYKVTTGLNNVPIGEPVLLHGKDQDTYSWTMTRPGGSNAMLADARTQNPEFIPDAPGRYEVQVTDENTGLPVGLVIFAGTWRGVIVGQDGNGRPISDPSCRSCHKLDGPAPDVFTPWAQTGHAEIFKDNMNTNTHYSTNCFSCHTVGYNPDVNNGGVDDAPDFTDFLNSGLIGTGQPDNWSMVLSDFERTAQLSNIQCENCHGPQNSAAHIRNDPRISLSSDVCASCHGEPLRHARYQQWQLSRHSNYELAIDEGESGSCARCHTANGFLKWLPILLGEAPGDPTADIQVTWTADETHPQTCQTCHDPHAIGTTSGDNPNATVRISGNTPMLIGGFQATNVGKGAICITCHNSRRGLRNDTTFGGIFRTSEAGRAPHGSAQGDVIMGQNAYFVPAGNRGSHSTIENTCVACHMENTPPPAVLSYNQGGTNHTFFAREDICADCHTSITTQGIQTVVQATVNDLKHLVEESILDLIEEQIAAGKPVKFSGGPTIDTPGRIASLEFGESRGQQAISVNMMDGTSFGPVAMSGVDVLGAGGQATDLYNLASPNLPKAGWNLLLVINDGSLGVHNFSFVTTALLAARQGLLNDSGAEPCVSDEDTICLRSNRFKVEVNWRSPQAGVNMFRPAKVSSLRTPDSGIFFFDDPNNLEFLIKVLNGCSLNQNYWVFFAGTTNVEFLVSVTDTVENVTRSYMNPFGQAADAVTDTAAFATCP